MKDLLPQKRIPRDEFRRVFVAILNLTLEKRSGAVLEVRLLVAPDFELDPSSAKILSEHFQLCGMIFIRLDDNRRLL